MKRILIGSAILVLVCITTFGVVTSLGSNGKTPEPPRDGKNIPSDVVWDEIHGIYKLIEVPTPVSTEDLAKNTAPVKWFGAQDEWIETNKNSTDPLDIAIIKWINNRKLNSHKSYYSSDEDETFKEIITLGVKYLPEMLKRIQKNDDVQTGVLMDAFSKISKVDSLKQIDISEEGKKEWKRKCNEILKNTPAKVKSAALKVKNGDIENAKNEIKEFGIFVLPYALDEANLGNKEMASLVDFKGYTDDDLKVMKAMVEKESN